MQKKNVNSLPLSAQRTGDRAFGLKLRTVPRMLARVVKAAFKPRSKQTADAKWSACERFPDEDWVKVFLFSHCAGVEMINTAWARKIMAQEVEDSARTRR